MYFAIGLPPLITDVVLEVFGERAGREVVIGVQLLVVGRVDGDHITVGRQQVTATEVLHVVGGLALQRRLDFLGHDAAPEDPGEHITDGALQATLEP
ncbi:Uncharacterised protein [Mycobacteroides abscessus subsp. abscessus]|nr:Uncharacterised protein [Mycobacteroides abscessus subsp. abscessus]